MSSPADVLAQGQAALRAGRIHEALAILAGAAARHPAVADIHAWLGEAQHALGRFDQAIAAYRAALRLQAGPLLNGRLGIALCQAGRLPEATAAFEAALALDPSFLDARLNLGMTRFQLGEREVGRRLIHQALVLKPDHGESWQIRASVAHAMYEDSATEMATRRALWMSPGSSAALALRALVLRRLGKPAETLSLARRAVALDPRQPGMLVIVGVALRDVGKAEAESVSSGARSPPIPGTRRPAPPSLCASTMLRARRPPSCSPKQRSRSGGSCRPTARLRGGPFDPKERSASAWCRVT